MLLQYHKIVLVLKIKLSQAVTSNQLDMNFSTTLPCYFKCLLTFAKPKHLFMEKAFLQKYVSQ